MEFPSALLWCVSGVLAYLWSEYLKTFTSWGQQRCQETCHQDACGQNAHRTDTCRQIVWCLDAHCGDSHYLGVNHWDNRGQYDRRWDICCQDACRLDICHHVVCCWDVHCWDVGYQNICGRDAHCRDLWPRDILFRDICRTAWLRLMLEILAADVNHCWNTWRQDARLQDAWQRDDWLWGDRCQDDGCRDICWTKRLLDGMTTTKKIITSDRMSRIRTRVAGMAATRTSIGRRDHHWDIHFWDNFWNNNQLPPGRLAPRWLLPRYLLDGTTTFEPTTGTAAVRTTNNCHRGTQGENIWR